MRNTYERINAGDIAGFGDLVADDFIETRASRIFPRRRGRSSSSGSCWPRFPIGV